MGLREFIRNFLGISDLDIKIEEIKKINDSDNENNNEAEVATTLCENEVSEYKNISIKDSFSERELLNLDFINSREVNNITNKTYIGKASRLSSVCQQLPYAATILKQQNSLNGAYKVVMPEGVLGNLMQYKNGTLGTPVIGANGRIAGHAGLVNMTKIPISPVMIFGAMSMVTGQYFMTKINTSLNSISKDVKEIINILMDDKESETMAIYNFLNYIKDNFNTILENDDLRISILTNLTSKIIELDKNMIFYNKRIQSKINNLDDEVFQSKLTKNRVSNFNDRKIEIESLIIQQHLCSELFSIAKIYELQIAQIYSSEYINSILQGLYNTINNKKQLEKLIRNDYKQVLNKIEAKSWINSKLVNSESERLFIGVNQRMNEFERNIYSSMEVIENIKNMNNRDNEFLIVGEDLYYLK